VGLTLPADTAPGRSEPAAAKLSKYQPSHTEWLKLQDVNTFLNGNKAGVYHMQPTAAGQLVLSFLLSCAYGIRKRTTPYYVITMPGNRREGALRRKAEQRKLACSFAKGAIGGGAEIQKKSIDRHECGYLSPN
jgi:hypothetical protein